jgi:hypothetical protein
MAVFLPDLEAAFPLVQEEVCQPDPEVGFQQVPVVDSPQGRVEACPLALHHITAIYLQGMFILNI